MPTPLGFVTGNLLQSLQPEVRRWSAHHADGRRAEIFRGGASLLRRASALPAGGAFSELHLGEDEEGSWALCVVDVECPVTRLQDLSPAEVWPSPH